MYLCIHYLIFSFLKFNTYLQTRKKYPKSIWNTFHEIFQIHWKYYCCRVRIHVTLLKKYILPKSGNTIQFIGNLEKSYTNVYFLRKPCVYLVLVFVMSRRSGVIFKILYTNIVPAEVAKTPVGAYYLIYNRKPHTVGTNRENTTRRTPTDAMQILFPLVTHRLRESAFVYTVN